MSCPDFARTVAETDCAPAERISEWKDNTKCYFWALFTHPGDAGRC
jgi:hypothetical protein